MSLKNVVLRASAVLAVPVAMGCGGKGTAMSAVPQRTGFVRALPDSNEYVRLLSKDDTVGLRSGLQTLQPGQDCGWHTTENYEEMIICLAGAGELAAEDGTRRPLAAGHYAYNPPQTRHNVFNTGTEPLRYIYVVAPVAAAAGDHR